MKIKNKTVMVTGGAGFIGSNLIEVLLKQGNKVLCFDNFSTGKKENIKQFYNNPNFCLFEVDILNFVHSEEIIKRDSRRINLDCIIHLAALGSVPRSIKEPYKSIENNTLGTVAVLDFAKATNTKRVIYASSSSVYGDNQDFPKTEDNTGNPLSPYAASKSACELFAKNYNFTYGMEAIGLRFFNVFGPKQNPDGEYAAVIPKFIKSIKSIEETIIYGDGSTSRDFTYVENVINGIQLAATAPSENIKDNHIFNIACSQSTSLTELFDMICEAIVFPNKEWNTKPKPTFKPERKGDIKDSQADISKAIEILGYKPTIGVCEGIKRTIEWRKEQITMHR